jgi:PmbA protein
MSDHITQELFQKARRAAAAAKAAGADDARVKVSRGREVQVEWRDGNLDRIRESTEQGMSLAVFAGGRYSGHSTSDLRDEAVAQWIKNAVAMTAHLAEDPHRKLPPPQRYAGMTDRDLELVDPSVGAITPQARIANARRLEAAAREGDDRIISVTTTVGDSDSRTVCVTTNGFEGAERATGVFWVAQVAVRGEGERRPSAWSWAQAHHAGDLPAIEGIGHEARERALAQIGAHQVATGRYEVIFENRVVGSLFGHLIRPLSGAALQQRQSFMEGKLGATIGAPLLDVRDEPHIPRGLGSSRFDGEGMATVPRRLFEDGVLRTYYLDTYYASKLEMEPTTGGTSNLLWRTGERDLAAMVAGMKEGLLITGFLGGNSNSTTGDFSLGVSGLWVKDGATMPVS